MMDLEHSQHLEQRPSTRMVPGQILAGRILQMPLLELEAFLRAEFQANPALLLEDIEPEPLVEPQPDEDWDPTVANEHDEAYDPFRTVAHAPSLRDHLVSQLRTQAPPALWAAGIHIIESLDEDGYFREDPLETADRFNLSAGGFEEVLRAVQALDPPGIAARDVTECLLIQAERHEDPPPLVARLLAPENRAALARRDVAALAADIGAEPTEVEAALRWMRDALNPFPAEGFRTRFDALAPRREPLERPDVVIHESDDDVWVECPGLSHLRLGLDAWYETLYQRIRRARGRTLPPDQRHIVEHVDKARHISQAVDMRGQTLFRIADHVVRRQEALVRHGPRHARPYTQKQAAEDLGLHESTICRAVRGKLVQMPRGDTVPFDYFFDTALPARAMVAEIIGREDPRRPLSDGQITEELRRLGVDLARRTVAKYRVHLRILPCEMRRARS